jgi:hypothetical protein
MRCGPPSSRCNRTDGAFKGYDAAAGPRLAAQKAGVKATLRAKIGVLPGLGAAARGTDDSEFQ